MEVEIQGTLLSNFQVLEEDVMLQGHDTCKYVFTDITFGVPGDHHMMVTCVTYQQLD